MALKVNAKGILLSQQERIPSFPTDGMTVLAPHRGYIHWLEDSLGGIADKHSAMASLEYYKQNTTIYSHLMGFCNRLKEEGQWVEKGEALFEIRF